jgi:hypothetical protein
MRRKLGTTPDILFVNRVHHRSFNPNRHGLVHLVAQHHADQLSSHSAYIFHVSNPLLFQFAFTLNRMEAGDFTLDLPDPSWIFQLAGFVLKTKVKKGLRQIL